MTPETPHSLWQSEVPSHLPRLAGHRSVDVAIVGAGLTGLWVAYGLRHLGSRLVVLDAEHPGFGASGRNAGFVLAGTADLYAETLDRLGSRDAAEWLALSRTNQALIKALAESVPDTIEFEANGSLYLAAADERDVLLATVARLQEAGVPAEAQAPEAFSPALSRLGYDVAARFSEDGAVHPAKLVHQLWQRVARHGVAVLGHSPVIALEAGGGSTGVTLTTPGGRVVAQSVVAATNAWLPTLLPEMTPYVRPVRGQVLATLPVAPLYAWPVYADHGYLYWRQRRDGRLVVGGYRQLDPDHEVGYDLWPHPMIQASLERLAETIAGAPVTVSHRWAGTMGWSPDRLPFADTVRPGILAVGGYSGHGVALTAAVGAAVARHLTTGAPLPPVLSLGRPSLSPSGAGRPQS